MRNPDYAPIVREAFSFSDAARWIRAEGVANFSVQLFRNTFVLTEKPHRAVMLAMAANYAEIFINGRAAASLGVRSYIFDKVYEVYDVSEYLTAGKNVVAVMNVDTGEEVRAGFALEIVADGVTVTASGKGFVYCREEAYLAPINHLIIGGGEEKVDGSLLTQGFAEVDFDDSKWTAAAVIGDELLHAPYERFRQSVTEGQTAEVRYASCVSAVMGERTAPGVSLKLAPATNMIASAMTVLSLDRAAEVSFVTRAGIRISVDGVSVPTNQNVSLAEGAHFLQIAYSWSPELLIRTEAALSLSSPTGDGDAWLCRMEKIPPVRYPWNVYRGEDKAVKAAHALLSYASFNEIPEEVRAQLEPMTVTGADSVTFDIWSRDVVIPANGFAADRIESDTRIRRVAETIAFDGIDTLLGERASAVIPAQKNGVYFILDFKTETVGRISFALDAPKGTVLDIVAFEMITDAGVKYMNPTATLRYLCADGEQSYLSRRLRGFRYLAIHVNGNASDVTLRDVHVIEQRYPTGEGDFVCSDERLNTIYRMSVRTAQVCMLDAYCDCPGYEQNPWTGDARCTAQVNLYNFGAYDFDKQYLKLIAGSIEDGLRRLYRARNPRYIAGLYLPCACFPTYPDGCIPVWSMMWLLQIRDHYMVTGDKAFLAEIFPSVKETMSRFVRMTDDRGLFDMQGAWNLIEWANNDLDFYGEVTANNVMLSYCFGAAAFYADELGETALAEDYRAKQIAYRDAVNAYCWDEEKRAYVDTVRDAYAYERYLAYMAERGMETVPYEEYVKNARISVQTNTMALLYECVPEERRESAMRFLLDNIGSGYYVSGTPANRTHDAPSAEEAPDGYVHIGSPFFLYFALKTLYTVGRADLALLSQRRDWGALLDSDIPTCVETFKKGKDWTRSAAHAWSASPAIFLKTDVLGVKPVKPGYAEFTVTPETGDLAFASGSVPTPYGAIRVSWRRHADGTLTVDCTAPKECKRIEVNV